MTAAVYRDTVRGVLVRQYGRVRNGAKVLAARIDASPRTVRNWMDGVSAPRGDELMKLMMECDELRDEIFRVVQEGKQCPND
ncbi:hypothetical protein [Acetobacter sp.]|uniref:hypothetical protein n=1 Tax=Acetobacter sp. TaxID=440 RepID=UPI0039E903C1